MLGQASGFFGTPVKNKKMTGNSRKERADERMDTELLPGHVAANKVSLSMEKNDPDTLTAVLMSDATLPGPTEENETLRPTCPWTQRLKRHFMLQNGITRGHIITYYVAVCMTICSFVFINSAQSHLLTESEGLASGVLGNEGTNISLLILIDEFIGLIFMGIWGTLSDMIGRRSLYAGGFVFMAIALILYPQSTCIFPTSQHAASFFSSLLFYRSIFSIGSSITSSLMAAILADSAEENCRGRFAGLVGLASCVGAVLAFGLMRLPEPFISAEVKHAEPLLALFIAFYILAGLLFGVAFLVCLFMSPPCHYKSLTVHSHCPFRNDVSPGTAAPIAQAPFLQAYLGKLKESIVLSWKHPMIISAYFSGFLARSVTIINVAFFPLWIFTRLTRDKICIPETMSLLVAVGSPKACSASRALSGRLLGILNTASLVFSPFVGYFSNRFSASKAVIGSCCLLIVGYTMILVCPNPLSKLHYLSVLALGVGQIGIIVSGLALVTSNSPKEHRGSISGLYSIFGSLGIITNTALSGCIYNAWTETGPFFVLSIWAAFVLVFTLIINLANARSYKTNAC